MKSGADILSQNLEKTLKAHRDAKTPLGPEPELPDDGTVEIQQVVKYRQVPTTGAKEWTLQQAIDFLKKLETHLSPLVPFNIALFGAIVENGYTYFALDVALIMKEDAKGTPRREDVLEYLRSFGLEKKPTGDWSYDAKDERKSQRVHILLCPDRQVNTAL